MFHLVGIGMITVSIVLLASRTSHAQINPTTACYDYDCGSKVQPSGCTSSQASTNVCIAGDQCFVYENSSPASGGNNLNQICTSANYTNNQCGTNALLAGKVLYACLCSKSWNCTTGAQNGNNNNNGGNQGSPTALALVACYNCISYDFQSTSHCNNPGIYDDIHTCSSGNQCLYYATTDTYLGEAVMYRTCYNSSVPINGCTNVTISGVSVYGCLCSNDFCNYVQLKSPIEGDQTTATNLATGQPINRSVDSRRACEHSDLLIALMAMAFIVLRS